MASPIEPSVKRKKQKPRRTKARELAAIRKFSDRRLTPSSLSSPKDSRIEKAAMLRVEIAILESKQEILRALERLSPS